MKLIINHFQIQLKIPLLYKKLMSIRHKKVTDVNYYLITQINMLILKHFTRVKSATPFLLIT